MTPEAFDAAALALPGATLSVQWGDDHVFKLGGKMFAARSGPSQPVIGASMKASEVGFAALTESGRARPAPYLARARWVRFDDLAEADEVEIAELLAVAHGLVAGKLTRAARRELGLA